MAGKKEEKLIEYIRELPAGARVSVRNLAKDNSVSEGTAYKAIKTAEKLQLVETRLRSGTVRLQGGDPGGHKALMLSKLIGRLGLDVLAGEEYSNVPAGELIFGDGSIEQFKAALDGAGENALCLLGDRPDLLFTAASRGVNMIITGGIHPGEALLREACGHGACVLSSQQDSCTVLSLLHAEMSGHDNDAGTDTADKWMRMPPYLYYNDMVIDWYNSYGPIFSMSSKHAVVNDSLHICGTVDATKVISTSAYTKISSLYEKNEAVYSVDVSAPMAEIAQHMVSDEISVAYITKNGELCGMITANDVLRYYLMNSTLNASPPGMPKLDELSSGGGRSVYTIQPGAEGAASAEILMGIVSAAAKSFASEHPAGDGIVASGSFFASPVPQSELVVSCERRRSSDKGSVIDIDICDEASSYANCMLVLSEAGGSV